MRNLLATAVMSLACGLSAAADDALPEKATFAVYPILSDLQRVRLARSDAEAPRLRAYVAISGNDLIDTRGPCGLMPCRLRKSSRRWNPTPIAKMGPSC